MMKTLSAARHAKLCNFGRKLLVGIIIVSPIRIPFETPHNDLVGFVQNCAQEPLRHYGRGSHSLDDFLCGGGAPLHDQEECVEQMSRGLDVNYGKYGRQINKNVVVVALYVL